MRKILILILLGAMGYGGWFYYQKYQQQGADNNAPKLMYDKVAMGDVRVAVEATGVIIPNTVPLAEVKSKASGTVKIFNLQPGDDVEKGDLMVEIDEVDELRNVRREEANVKMVKANLDEAQASLALETKRCEINIKKVESDLTRYTSELEEAKKQFERKSKLFASGSVPEQDVDSAKNSFNVATANYERGVIAVEEAKVNKDSLKLKQSQVENLLASQERAHITLEDAKKRLEETKIYAKFSGRIIEKKVNEGDIIASGVSSVSGGTTLATMADLSKVFVEADIDESDIGKIKPGSDVVITMDAYPDNVFTGVVDRIAPQGVQQNSVTVVRVKVLVTGKDSSGRGKRGHGGRDHRRSGMGEMTKTDMPEGKRDDKTQADESTKIEGGDGSKSAGEMIPSGEGEKTSRDGESPRKGRRSKMGDGGAQKPDNGTISEDVSSPDSVQPISPADIPFGKPPQEFGAKGAVASGTKNFGEGRRPGGQRHGLPEEVKRITTTANVSITISEVKDVLYVPNEAVRFKDGKRGVYVKAGDTNEWQEVETGISNANYTEIKEGLTEGQEVVVKGLESSSQSGMGGLFGRPRGRRGM